jgi:hypothetical protein
MIEHIAGDQRMRFTEASTFTCSRCRGVETSNLLAISDSDCSKRFCNGCYGLLVSQQQAADEIYRESVLQAKRVAVAEKAALQQKVLREREALRTQVAAERRERAVAREKADGKTIVGFDKHPAGRVAVVGPDGVVVTVKSSEKVSGRSSFMRWDNK